MAARRRAPALENSCGSQHSAGWSLRGKVTIRSEDPPPAEKGLPPLMLASFHLTCLLVEKILVRETLRSYELCFRLRRGDVPWERICRYDTRRRRRRDPAPQSKKKCLLSTRVEVAPLSPQAPKLSNHRGKSTEQ